MARPLQHRTGVLIGRLLKIVGVLCALIILVMALAVVFVQTSWFRTWLRDVVVRQANAYLNGQVSIGRLEGNLLFGFALEDVALAMEGERVVEIGRVSADYNALTFLDGGIVIDRLRIDRPLVRLERTADGWNLARLIKPLPPGSGEPGRAMAVDSIEISDGTLVIVDRTDGIEGVELPSRVERLEASLRVTSRDDDLTVDIPSLSGRTIDPSLDIEMFSGVIRLAGDRLVLSNVRIRTPGSALEAGVTMAGRDGSSPELEVRAASETLALEEIARFVPALRGFAMRPAFEIVATGPMNRLSVDLDVREAALGRVTGDLTLDVTGPDRRVTGDITLDRVNTAPLMAGAAASGDGQAPTPVTTDITGRARIDVVLPGGDGPLSGTYAVNAPRVEVMGYAISALMADGRIDWPTIRTSASAIAYGSRTSTAGTVTIGDPLRLDLGGRVAGLDLRNLPASLGVPAVPGTLDLAYTLEGRGRAFAGEVTLDESTLAGATIAAGTVARVQVGDGPLQFAAQGQVSDLDLQQIGAAFEVTALAEDRYRSRIAASFDVTGSGGGEHPLALEASGTLTDAEIVGARLPRLDVAAHLQDGDIRAEVRGSFADLDPSVLSGDERMAGSLRGDVDIETTIRSYAEGVTVDTVDIAGRVSLDESLIGDIAVDSAVVAGQYAAREGQLTELRVSAVDLTVSGMGPIALTETGSTAVTLHAETPSLARLGALFGQPLTGIALLDAELTGNARRLELTGTLKGSNVGHGGNRALSLDSRFAASMPDLTPERTVASATNLLTFLELAGYSVTELAAEVAYEDSMLTFDATAQDGVRELEAAGTAVFHPEYQEVQVPRLALRTEDIEWRTPPGSNATIQYTADRLSIENLALVSLDQQVAVNGTIGTSGEMLQVHATNVDVAEIDRLLLGDERLAGRFNAEAVVSGPLTAPAVTAQFALTAGAFEAFTFESFEGRVEYSGEDVVLDVRMQQTPAHWLTAKGSAPLTLFRGTPESERGRHRAASPGDEVRLDVSSSEIDLGVIQGFTSALTMVTGVLQANLTVTGSGYDPHVNGVIDIRGGAFAVPDLGTSYTGLETRITLDDTGMSIDEFSIRDARGESMTVGGSLALHAGTAGAVDVTLHAERFEVIRSSLAEMALNVDATLTNELRAPRIQGRVEVHSGTIHIADVLERLSGRGYATAAAALPADGAEAGQEDIPAEPGVFDALALDLELSVPNNLVVRGNDIRAARAPVALGDMNVTLGGAIQARKEPGRDLTLRGDVNTVRGTYRFQGRQFDILRDGRIGFSGTETAEIDPLLDLQARRVISGIETTVHVRGTMRSPELSFTSSPPLDEADILALIIFNQPVNALSESQQVSLAERAGALAGGLLTSGLTRSIGNALRLDEFDFQVQGDDGTGPSLVVGEQFGRNLFFRLRQVFGSEQTTELVLEYQITDFLRLRASSTQGDSLTQRVEFRRVERAGLDLIFFFSY